MRKSESFQYYELEYTIMQSKNSSFLIDGKGGGEEGWGRVEIQKIQPDGCAREVGMELIYSGNPQHFSLVDLE